MILRSRKVPSRILSSYRKRGYVLDSKRFYTAIAGRSYEDAINTLNNLQTPYEVLKKKWDAGIRLDEQGNVEMKDALKRIGYTQHDLTRLNIVHVAGTKGKGSTCAYVDNILAQYRKRDGFPKVGLFTSPHLIAVRERIRINSVPIAADLFAKYFFEVWDRLEASGLRDKPVYFRYLTLMSYHAFIQEKVNVAIYEVGVGGEYDSTNIADAPAVTGISALGIDHTFTLGDTIDKIAWNKAGIQKPGVASFTVTQPAEAMEVIKARAEERKVKSLAVLEQDSRLKGVNISPDAAFQKSNASLAIALAEVALDRINSQQIIDSPKTNLPEEFVRGLETMIIRGRCEKKNDGNITWFLDGAHTDDSIKVASKWFSDESSTIASKRVLIFNQQGQRDINELLEGVYKETKAQGKLVFDHVIFCPTIPAANTTRKDFINLSTDAIAVAGLTAQKGFAEKWAGLDPDGAQISIFSSVEEAFEHVRQIEAATAGSQELHAFVTGSVHLVGRALGILEDVDAL